MPRPSALYWGLFLSAGPVLGIASYDVAQGSYSDGQTTVWTQAGTRVLGSGVPLALYTDSSGSKAIVAVNSKLGTAPAQYSVIDGTNARSLAGVLSESSSPSNKSNPCAAAAFTADGTALLAREERSVFRLTDGTEERTAALPSGQYIHQCFLFTEEGSARVHLVFAASPSPAVQNPTIVHHVVFDGAKVTELREVDVTPDTIQR